MKAFSYFKIKTDLNGNEFTHWLPLYFGESGLIKEEVENKENEKVSTETILIDIKLRFYDYFNSFEKILQKD